MQTENNAPENRNTLKELAEIKAQAREQAKSGGNHGSEKEELPSGSQPVNASHDNATDSENSEEKETGSQGEETSQEETGSPAPAPVSAQEEEELIRIGDKEFKTQAEAIRYAEQLEEEKFRIELYNQGVRDALNSQQPQAQQAPPEEDKFDEEFYSNPKEKLKQIKEEAKREALLAIQAENNKERLWTQFLEQNPDIERRDAERILGENWDTIGKMTDVPKAMKILAQKTRAEYQRIADKFKPRTELPNKNGQALSMATQTPRSVTPARKEEKPLTLAQQMKMLRKR